MASYAVNERGVAHARELINARQYVLESDWGELQPRADDENAFLESHSWDDYAEWHLGLTDGPADETKARYAFVYGDFRRVHRMGLIACLYRAAEWRIRTSSSQHTTCSSGLTREATEPAEAGSVALIFPSWTVGRVGRFLGGRGVHAGSFAWRSCVGPVTRRRSRGWRRLSLGRAAGVRLRP